jgi:hypothetical protein
MFRCTCGKSYEYPGRTIRPVYAPIIMRLRYVYGCILWKYPRWMMYGRNRPEDSGKWSEGGSSIPMSGSYDRIFSVPVRTDRSRQIRSPDTVTVFLLPPSYHFPESSDRKRRHSCRFPPEIHGTGCRNGRPGTASYTVPYYCAQNYEKIRSVYGAVWSKFTVKIRIAILIDLGIIVNCK